MHRTGLPLLIGFAMRKETLHYPFCFFRVYYFLVFKQPPLLLWLLLCWSLNKHLPLLLLLLLLLLYQNISYLYPTSYHSLLAAMEPKRFQADSGDYDQPAQMRRLIIVFAGLTCSLVGNAVPRLKWFDPK